MTNSDTQFGTYNKLTKEIRAYWNDDPANATVRNEGGRDENSSVIYQKFGGNVETAKSLFLTEIFDMFLTRFIYYFIILLYC